MSENKDKTKIIEMSPREHDKVDFELKEGKRKEIIKKKER